MSEEHRRIKDFVVPNGIEFAKIADRMPADAKLIAVSQHAEFRRDGSVLRIWSSTFPVVPRGNHYSPVDLIYELQFA